MEKVYYVFDGNKIIGTYVDKREACTEYATTERNSYTALEVIELEPQFGHLERKNHIVTVLLNSKPYKCVVNDPYKAQQLIDLYEEQNGLDDYRNYTFCESRIYT